MTQPFKMTICDPLFTTAGKKRDVCKMGVRLEETHEFTGKLKKSKTLNQTPETILILTFVKC